MAAVIKLFVKAAKLFTGRCCCCCCCGCWNASNCSGGCS